MYDFIIRVAEEKIDNILLEFLKKREKDRQGYNYAKPMRLFFQHLLIYCDIRGTA